MSENTDPVNIETENNSNNPLEKPKKIPKPRSEKQLVQFQMIAAKRKKETSI